MQEYLTHKKIEGLPENKQRFLGVMEMVLQEECDASTPEEAKKWMDSHLEQYRAVTRKKPQTILNVIVKDCKNASKHCD